MCVSFRCDFLRSSSIFRNGFFSLFYFFDLKGGSGSNLESIGPKILFRNVYIYINQLNFDIFVDLSS